MEKENVKKEDYYALINYRGRERHYYVSKSYNNDIRVEYINYNPNSEWYGVWIKNGKDRIVKVFDKSTKEYKYFKNLNRNFKKLIHQWEKKNRDIYNLNYFPFIGTLNVLACYKKALKITKNPLKIKV